MKIDLYLTGVQKPSFSFEADVLGTPPDVIVFGSVIYRFTGSVSRRVGDRMLPSYCYVTADSIDLNNNPQFRGVPV